MQPVRERDFGQMLREAVELNGLSYRNIVDITERSENTVFKWLNGTLTPDEGSIYRVYLALYQAKMKIPRELSRANSAMFSRAKAWGKRNDTGLAKPTMVGEKFKIMMFKYNGKLLKVTDIAEASGKHRATVFGRVRDLEQGSDVTKIIDSISSTRGRPPKRTK